MASYIEDCEKNITSKWKELNNKSIPNVIDLSTYNSLREYYYYFDIESFKQMKNEMKSAQPKMSEIKSIVYNCKKDSEAISNINGGYKNLKEYLQKAQIFNSASQYEIRVSEISGKFEILNNDLNTLFERLVGIVARYNMAIESAENFLKRFLNNKNKLANVYKEQKWCYENNFHTEEKEGKTIYVYSGNETNHTISKFPFSITFGEWWGLYPYKKS